MNFFFCVFVIIKSVTLLANESGSSLNERTYKEALDISLSYSQNSLNSTKNNCTLTATSRIDLHTKQEETVSNEVILHHEVALSNNDQLEKTDTANKTPVTDNDNICSYVCCCCVNLCKTKNSSLVKPCNHSTVKEMS